MGLNALLKSENYQVSSSNNGNEGLIKALELMPDLVILDINLPRLNGFEVCRILREKKFTNSIIMLTAQNNKVDKVVGLEIGADDYITKPFDNREVLARVRAQLRKLKRIKVEMYEPSDLDNYNRKLLSIMFTDIQGYSKIMNINEKLALNILENHNKIINGCVKKAGGKVIEMAGDAFLVSFMSAYKAVMCAINIQNEFKKYNRSKINAEKIKVRIGIHLGDVVEFEGKLKGDVVNIAARIQQNAKPNSVFISEAVYSIIKNKTGLKIKNARMFSLKNINEPINLYSIII